MKQSIFAFLFLSFSFCVFGQDTTKTSEVSSNRELFEIRQLAKTAESENYGFSGEFPVKVGAGSNGGPYNQRAYLELLRDGQGEPVKYKRVGGGCCPYKSKNAIYGDYALVDSYEVSYKNKKGKKKKVIIYISFYDYEEPMIPVGFQASSSN